MFKGHVPSVVASALVVASLGCSSASARPNNSGGSFPPSNRPADWNRGGTICETSTNGRFRDFVVNLTNPAGVDIPAPGWPATGTATNGQTIYFPVPAGRIGGQDVADGRNTSTIRSRSNRGDPEPAEILGTSELYIESVFFDEMTETYILEGIFDFMSQVYGDNVFLFVPDLFGDTNGNDMLDDGDTLYSLVDLRIFTQNPPDFGDNEVFQIVNGVSDGLPGMIFSTTPFEFDPSTGWRGGSTPFSGEAVNASYHGIASVPAPGVTLFMAVWFGVASRGRRV